MKTTMFIQPLWTSIIIGAFAMAVFISQGQATSIAWGSAQNINADSDVSTTGTSVAAYNIGPSGSTNQVAINGVTFVPFLIAFNASTNTIGNFTLTEQSGTYYAGSASTYQFSSNYNNLLQTATNIYTITVPVNTLRLTMSGLVVGNQYQFQWWCSNRIFFSNSDNPTSATAGGSITLDNDTGQGIGQYALGTFTADATSQIVDFDGTINGPVINGFQLKSIPEPSTWGLLTIGSPSSDFFAPSESASRTYTPTSEKGDNRVGQWSDEVSVNVGG